MIANLNFSTLGMVIIVCISFATAGSLLVGNSLKNWYPTLKKPRFQIPIIWFALVGLVVYILDAAIFYRLIAFLQNPQGKVISITALLVVMAFNECWNIAFFRLQNTLVGFLGIIAFLAPLIILQVALFQYDSFSATLLLPYCLWVILYDLPWTYRLWKLN